MRTPQEFIDAGKNLRDNLASGVEGVDEEGRNVRIRMDNASEIQLFYPKPEGSRVILAGNIEAGLAWASVHVGSAKAHVHRTTEFVGDELREPQHTAAVASSVQQHQLLDVQTAAFAAAYDQFVQNSLDTGVNNG